MNRTTNNRNRALLAIATLALTGRIALANDLPSTDLTPQNLVVARLEASAEKSVRQAEQQVHGAAVAAALQGVNDDNKRELELRLSGRKSMLLAADR